MLSTHAMYSLFFSSCFLSLQINCFRGSPVAIYSVRVSGIPVPGINEVLLPVVNYLNPHIAQHLLHGDTTTDTDTNLPLLRQICVRLGHIVIAHPELIVLKEGGKIPTVAAMRRMAMLCGPFHPILAAVQNNRILDSGDIATFKSADGPANNKDKRGVRSQPAPLTISANFSKVIYFPICAMRERSMSCVKKMLCFRYTNIKEHSFDTNDCLYK